MNILHIISAPAAGGAEIYVKDLAKALVKAGNTVHIGFLNHAVEIGRSPEFEIAFLKELSSLGIPYFFLPVGTRVRIWRGMKYVQRYIAENNIEVFHSHLTYGIVCGALASVPRVYTHHNIKMRLNRILFSIVSSFVDELIGISKSCTEALAKYSSRSVTTIFNGIDPDRIDKRALTPRSLGEKVRCIAVGQICAQKNFELLVEAVALVPTNTRERLVIAIAGEGSGADTEKLKRTISINGLNESVVLLGNRSDILSQMASSDLFLMSSIYEGLPIALIEAAASGLPCIVTDVGGCREIVETCCNGIVVERSNAKAIADALSRLIQDPQRFRAYSESALRLSSVFSINRSCAAHISLYETLAKS